MRSAAADRVSVERPRRPPPAVRRAAGELRTAEFLLGLLELARAQLPEALRACQTRQQWSLAKLWYDDPLVHYAVWPHRARGRVEVGLHFETRDSRRNAALLECVADELAFLKATLGDGLEAEPWDKGWASGSTRTRDT